MSLLDNLELQEVKPPGSQHPWYSWRRWIAKYWAWRYDRDMKRMYNEPKTCDGCSESFKLRDLTPTSGDWWLCTKCMDKLPH